MIRGFIFDMDGTVVDSTANDYQAWDRAFKELEIQFPYEDFLSLLGAKGEEIVKKFIDLPKEKVKSFLTTKDNYFKEFSEKNGLSLIPGVEDFLQKLQGKGIPAALATGAGSNKLDFIFERIPIQKYFKAIVTANDVHAGKPDPEIFLKAAEKIQVRPSEALVMEDATFGIEAAIRGGMKCIAITSTNPAKALQKATRVISSYEELDEALLGKLTEHA